MEMQLCFIRTTETKTRSTFNPFHHENGYETGQDFSSGDVGDVSDVGVGKTQLVMKFAKVCCFNTSCLL